MIKGHHKIEDSNVPVIMELRQLQIAFNEQNLFYGPERYWLGPKKFLKEIYCMFKISPAQTEDFLKLLT